jgi:hypothetical protein
LNFLTSGELNHTLSIKLGTDQVARYSFANHKLNLAVRKTIENHDESNELMKGLSRYAAKAKKSLNLAKLHRDAKCKLRVNQQTRWLSPYLMCYCFIKARKIGLIDGHLFDFEKVVTYYQILSPLYKMNLIFERTDSSIGEVVPFIRDQRGS